jgi:hypothetical protein
MIVQHRHSVALTLALCAALAVAPGSLAQSTSPTGEPAANASPPIDGATCHTTESGTVGAVDHPTDPAAVVLRMFSGGGFVPQSIAFIETPQFTLYGNDVAIFRAPPPPDAEFGDPWPAFQCLQLTSQQVDELLTFALDQGGLADADTDYPNPNITDVGTTVFTIDAGGVDKTVSVFALGFEMAPEDQLDAREQFAVLGALLGDFGATVDGEQPFDVPAYHALLEEDLSDEPLPAMPWPLTDVQPGDFALGDPTTEVLLTPDQVAAVTTVPNGGQASIPLTSPDGDPLFLSVRPLLR